MTKKESNQIVKIAQENIISMENRSDLEQRFSDEEDFFEISVWGLKDALVAAYELGKKNR